jgi:acyl-ACP thioesterase
MCNPANPKASEPVSIWQETFPIRFAAIDSSDKMTMGAVFQCFQEAAISHAENLRVGRVDMEKAGHVWLLSRFSVVMDRRPGYCETVTLRTWPRGGEKLFAIRDFDIRAKDNITAVSARSCWIIIDIEKRRPMRPQSIMDTIPKNDGLDAMNFIPEALKQRENLQKIAERKALYTDVDYNGHVNNVRYIHWIEDTLEPQLLEKANKMRLDINYMNEILSGETTEIFSFPIEVGEEGYCAAFAFEGRKTGDAQTAFRAELRLFKN